MSTICLAALACKAVAFFGLALRLPERRRNDKPDELPPALQRSRRPPPRTSPGRTPAARTRRR